MKKMSDEKNTEDKKLILLIDMIIQISLSQTKIWQLTKKIDLNTLNIKYILWIYNEKNLTKKQRDSLSKYIEIIKANEIDDVKKLYKTESQHSFLMNKIKYLMECDSD